MRRRAAVVTGRTGTGVVLPGSDENPVRAVSKRLVIALLAMVVSTLAVWLDRDGYRDTADGVVTLADALYFSAVSLSTTGYGDITPVGDAARVVNIVLITPLRVLFLIVLIGTTLEVLTARTRAQLRQKRWRSSLRDHTVVVGYGTKGRSAVRALLDDGFDRHQVVVVDNDPVHLADAGDDGVAAVSGDGTRSDVLRRAEVAQAAQVIVAVPRDDAAVLVTLTARRENPEAHIVAAVRESENAGLLRDGGADSVVVSSAAAGRMLGVAASKPATGDVFEDLLVPGEGLELSERDVERAEVGLSTRETRDLVVAVVRDGGTTLFHAAGDMRLRKTDRVVVIRPAASGAVHVSPGDEPV